MERLTSKRTREEVDWVSEIGYKHIWERLNEIENILGDDYDLEHLKELVEADRGGQVLIIPNPENSKMSDYLEPMKIGYALKSELMKLELRQKTRPKDISPLDYTIIFCLEAALERMKNENEA